MKRSLVVIMMLVAGCATVPFHEAALVPLQSADPQVVVERFRSGNPESFQLLNTIVFEYTWFTFGGIGCLEVNAKDRFYKVALMNHMGVKLFEVSGNRDGVLSQSAIGPLADKGDIARAVGDDIMRVYFDLVPSAEARVAHKKNRLVFRQPSDAGALEYVFAGEPTVLRTKTYYEDNRAVWRVSYYDYLIKNEKHFPAGIILQNYRHGYRLIVRQKEIRR
jgi:outer membrane biogenesis lipoprotein LolB